MPKTSDSTHPIGSLFVVSAPSGTGKTSLVAAVCDRLENLVVSVSYTTRPQRAREVEGVHYHFVDEPTFEAKLEQGEFLEHARVFGNYYGTSGEWVHSKLRQGLDVILEIDWQGAAQIRSAIQSVGIFILPPSAESLLRRLRDRAQDDEAVIAKRIAGAVEEMSHFAEFDYLIVNDVFNDALRDLEAIIRSSRLVGHKQRQRHRALVDSLSVKHQ